MTTTSLNTIVEANYALNKDETKGLLAGIQYTKIMVETAPCKRQPQHNRLCRYLLSVGQ